MPTASIHDRVHRRLLTDGADHPLDDRALTDLVRTEAPLLGDAAVASAVARVRARIGGVGSLEPLLADPTVSDVLVNGPGRVWIERAGHLEQTDIVLDRAAIELLIERVVAPLGLRADRTTPIVDARLPDGSRVHVVLAPLAVDGPCVTIRRFRATTVPVTAFCPAPLAGFLAWAVTAGLNMVICGGAGAGKTTLLNALCQHLPFGERIVTVEDPAELQLPRLHVIRLETRPATPDGLAALTVRDLVRAALRMRPDRIVVGEVRGAETVDMVMAMNTGHDGSLSTCHANSPIDGLRRLETLVLMGGLDLPLSAAREQVVAAVDLLVQVGRQADGSRRVVAVAEVCTNPDDPQRVRSLTRDDGLARLHHRAPRRATASPPP
ncbi:MAG TPA: ATPase, T2SS/T4P/T4SS family [Acidimicrobiales bacterium]